MPRPSKKLRELLPPIDVCGMSVRILVDDEMKEYGVFFPTLATIKIRTRENDGAEKGIPFSRDFVKDTLIHELTHAVIYYGGLAGQMRNRLKMKRKREWDDFEEDFLVGALTPLIVATLGGAGMLVFPSLPRPSRHRRP